MGKGAYSVAMVPARSSRLHGTALAFNLRGARLGVVLLGRPGAGKSSLALRAIRHNGARLVADDQITLARRGDKVLLSPPARLAGLLHVAGVGFASFPHQSGVALVLVVRLTQARLPLLPKRESMSLLGARFSLLRLNGHEAAAAERLELATLTIGALGGVPKDAILSRRRPK